MAQPTAKTSNKYVSTVTKGIILENPVLRLVLGTCPTLAVSTSVKSAIGMGISATLVLIASNIIISALRKIIPDKVRIPAYIIIIATFVSIVQMLVKAFLPDLDRELGIFLPLIVVNCIILGRAEAFASKHSVGLSALDGLGMGIGFTAALLAMSIIREFIGSGSLYGMQIIPESIPTFGLMVLPPGGFFVFGIVMAIVNHISKKMGLKEATLNSCAGCAFSGQCASKNPLLNKENA